MPQTSEKDNIFLSNILVGISPKYHQEDNTVSFYVGGVNRWIEKVPIIYSPVKTWVEDDKNSSIVVLWIKPFGLQNGTGVALLVNRFMTEGDRAVPIGIQGLSIG